MTCAVLIISGNTPVMKHKFANLDNHNAKKGLNILRIKTGILQGPVDFFMLRASISFSTSAGTVGERKKEFGGLSNMYVCVCVCCICQIITLRSHSKST